MISFVLSCLLSTDVTKYLIIMYNEKISWSQGSCYTEFPLYLIYNKLIFCPNELISCFVLLIVY